MGNYFSLSEWYFLNGIKRTCINYPNFSRYEYMKRNYPYIGKKEFLSLGNCCIFFQSEPAKEAVLRKYIKGNEHINVDDPEHARIIGNILEYPPKAIDFYIKGGRDKFPDRAIGMQFCGNQFIANILDLEENARWMWEKFPYPEDDTLLIRQDETMQFAQIEFKDFNKVEEIVAKAEEYLNKQRG